MPITITADTAAELRAQVSELFPALASTVPVAQAPGPDAKELILVREHLAEVEDLARNYKKDRDEAITNLAKLEAAYSTQADLLREAQGNSAPDAADLAMPDALEAIALICDTLGSPRDIQAAPALVAEVKQERDQAQAALKEAQEALESTAKEIERLKSLVGTPGEDKPKTTRKPRVAAKEAPAASDDAAAPGAFPESFTSLPALPEGEIPNGTGVVVAIANDVAAGGWLTPGGIVERRFEGTDRYEVKLVQGGYQTVHRDAMRAVPDAPAPLERAPVTPLVTPAPAEADAVADRLINEDERQALGDLAKKLKLTPDQMKGLIQKHFAPKAASAELTVTELAQLHEHMDREASIPF